MKERPILFSGSMVCAILEGRKTQTRRIMKPQPASVEYWRHGERSDRLNGVPSMRDEDGRGWAMCGPFRCPFIAEGMCAGFGGKLGNSRIGDTTERKSLLWVKETHAFYSLNFENTGKWHPSDPDTCAHYKAGCPWQVEERIERWRPSIFMPRWASRITLEVTGVRVERLQEISERDAQAEGIEKLPPNKFRNYLGKAYADGLNLNFAAESYRTLWESINGRGSWDANPFVWIVEFRHVERQVRS